MANQENEKIDFKINFNEIYQDNKILFWGIINFISLVFMFYLLPIENLNNFGDYFGGVLNPILAFVSFIAILWTVALQRHSIKLQARELSKTTDALKESKDAQKLQAQLFKQQQFETTFFNMLDFLRGYSSKEPLKVDILYGKNDKFKGKVLFSNSYTDQYPLTLLSLLDSVENFSDKIEERQKYINIIKANLDINPFLKMIKKYLWFNENFVKREREESHFPEDIIEYQIYYPYTELRNMIEKYSLFSFISHDEMIDYFAPYENDYPNRNYTGYNEILKYFNLSAFGCNYFLLADRIKLEENPAELAKYATSPYKIVRLAIAENKYTAKETLILLSQDSEEEVRQAAINNENFKS